MTPEASTSSVDVVDAFGPVVAEWTQLAGETGGSPFAHAGWVHAWWSSFGSGILRAVTVRRAGRLVALAPVEIVGSSWRAPANAHTPSFDLLALDGDAAQMLADGLFARRPPELRVGPLRSEAVAGLERAAGTAGYRTVTRPAGRAPYIRLEPDLSALERSFSHNLRHDVRRRMRRLCEAGAVSVEISSGGPSLDALLAEGFDVEARSWKGAARTAIASSPATVAFYRSVAQWAASVGWLRLAFLRLDGRAIAFQFDLEHGGAYYSLKIGYDPSFERFAPGKLLAYAMLLRAAARGASVYELLGTDEAWKQRWTHDGRDLAMLHAFSPSVGGRVARWAFVHGRPLVRRVPLARRVAASLRR
jgi:CelD/BcsL family acetyltransferase involved in cellulose biosynthesis